MKILLLELYKYNRFLVKGISYLKYEPETIIQIILGPNGSGKSSLLKELSPLPPDLKNEFAKGGYKRSKLTHNNSVYELVCERGENGNVFSFIKDGEELNPGHTVSIFRDLVRIEFGITPEIHDLMIGSIRFTEMDTGSRRSWFTRLPTTDYTYAISYYKKLAKTLRDTSGAIEHVYSRLLQVKEGMVTTEEQSEIKEDLIHLKDYLTFLLENKRVVAYGVDEATEIIEKTSQKILSISSRMKRLVASFDNSGNAKDISELVQQLQEHQTNVSTTSTLIKHIFDSSIDLERSIDELERNQAGSVEQLQQKMNERKTYIKNLLGYITLGLEFDDPNAALSSLNAVSPYLLDVVAELEPDPERKYGREYYERLKQAHTQAVKDLDKYKEELAYLNARKKELDHIKEHDNVECPNCDHVFNRSFNQKEYEELLRAIESVEKKSSSVVFAIEQSKEDMEKIARRFELLRGFSQLANSHPSLDSFWTYFRGSILFDDPSGTIRSLEEIRKDLNILCEVKQLSDDEKREAESIKTMMAFKNSSLEDLKKEYEKKSKEIYELTEKKSYYQSKVRSTERALATAREINELRTDLESSLEDRKERIESMTDIIRNEIRGKMIQAVQLEITARENRLSSITSQQSVINELEAQLDSLKKRKEVLYAATKVLSPSEGLIAKGITGFINHFVGQMNTFIKKIWSYPLEILPIVPDENLDLDYKFEMKVGDFGKSPDISKLSRGQKEIIDLAFKVIAAQYLNLGHFPLYLDEFGASFDKEHRHAVAEMMHSLTNTSSFSNVYIISHYEEMYGSFKNTDITVFHDPQLEPMQDSAFNKVATFA